MSKVQTAPSTQSSADSEQRDVESPADPSSVPVPGASAPDAVDGGPTQGLELLGDVDLNVTIELGRTQMLLEDVLKLSPGSVVELDKLAGDPVDVYVNHRLIARGEVLVLNDNFCVRISEIMADLQDQAEQVAADQTVPTPDPVPPPEI